MHKKIHHYHTNMLNLMAVGTLQLAFGAVCKGVHFDGLMNRWHRGTMCSQGTVCAQVGSTELQSRTLL